MKDKRRICVVSPKLQTIRNNLRIILNLANNAHSITIIKKMRSVTTTSDGSKIWIDNLTSDDLAKYRRLQNELAVFEDIWHRAICTCYACGKSDRDMIFNESYDAWYCFECFERNKDFYLKILQERAKKGIAKVDYDDFDEDYHKSFVNQSFQPVSQTQEGVLWDQFMQEIKGKNEEELARIVEEYVLKDDSRDFEERNKSEV